VLTSAPRAAAGQRKFVPAAWRLAWPTGSVVYEIDQPNVLAFDLMATSNRPVPPGLDSAVPESVFVEGRLD
jgi:O-methyltransferase involved in polyketide biosynthesis